MKASIYAANLHNGGGATGASIFIADLPRLHALGELEGVSELEVVVSDTVAKNIANLDEVAQLPGVRLLKRDDRPDLRRAVLPRRDQPRYDVQFVVRGPHYAPLAARRTILGFADATMYFGTPEGSAESLSRRTVHHLKNRLKRRLMPLYDEYVVQTDRLAAQLRRGMPGKTVTIIPNSPSPVFRDPGSWEDDIPLPPKSPGTIRLFYPARGYAHKNHVLIGPMADLLEERYSIGVEVVTTLRSGELAALPAAVSRRCINVGEVRVTQCPPLYRACDGVFFPSLSETSSVTPLEGMVMSRPVLASDRSFIKDTAGDVPFYFDPLDPVAAGEMVRAVFSADADVTDRLDRGVTFVESLPSSFERSLAYIRLIREG